MRTIFSSWKTELFNIPRNWNFHNPWRSCWFCRCIIMTYCWHRCLGLRRRCSCFMRFDCIRHVGYPPRHRNRRDGLGGTMEAARQCVCESTHLLDQQTAVRLTMRHGLYNEKLNGKLNHICWDKEIVKTVHPQLRGNCKTNDMSKVSFVTIEAHVLGDDRLQQCQRHQTDIRTLEQPFLTARSTIWHRRNGSNKVWITNGLALQCTHMQQIP